MPAFYREQERRLLNAISGPRAQFEFSPNRGRDLLVADFDVHV
jgi:hypothetical protein